MYERTKLGYIEASNEVIRIGKTNMHICTLQIGGMWVDPAFRANGIGAALVAEILTWAHQQKQSKLELWVTQGNQKAIGLYERVSFVDTGKRDRLPSNPSLQII